LKDLTPFFRKLTPLIYGVLKTRQPFDANWAKKATVVMDVTMSAVMPAKK
jgi:hypothetical protein